jgi:hypothetical protein
MRTNRLLLAENISEALVDELRGKKIRRVVARLRQKLDDIHAHNFLMVGDCANQRSDLHPIEAAGLGRPCGRNEGGIEAVEINREVDIRTEIGEDFCDPALHGCARDVFCPVDAGAQVGNRLRFFHGKRANANLHGGSDLDHTTHRASVARGISLILVAQISVRVDLKHAEILEFLRGRGDKRRRKRMFATEGDGEFIVLE